MTKVLVIGGLGYIGRRLSPYLVNNGYDVDIVDSGWFSRPKDFLMVSDDIKKDIIVSDYNAYDVIPFIGQADIVILLAGHSSVGMCSGNGRFSFNNNVRNFVYLVNCMRNSQTLIYASSASVYGNQPPILLDENTPPLMPAGIYDMTKVMIDMYSNEMAKLSRSPKLIGLRFGTVCGVSQNFRNELMLNAMVSSAVSTGIVGFDSPPCYRALLGLGDLCKAIELIIKNSPPSGVYNIASFNGTSEIFANVVASITKAKLNVYVPKNKTPYNFILSIVKSFREFSYIPEETAEGITTELVEFINNNESAYIWHRKDMVRYE